MNDLYKLHHKPIKNSDKVKFKQGYYKPTNPEKCLTQIVIYRSGWEAKFCQWCDLNPNVVRWASEPIGIKYLNPISNMEYCMKNGLNPNDPHNWKVCNYYTDFWIELQDSNDPTIIKRIFIEVKPFDQTQCPKPLSESASLKERKAFNKAAETYLVHQQKWSDDKKYFNERGADFMVITEKSLQKLGLMS